MTSSGSDVSAKAVKPRMSQNSETISRRLPSSSLEVALGQDHLGQLRRQKALELLHALDLGDLLDDASLQTVVEAGEFGIGLLLDLRLQRLQTQHGAHAGEQGRLLDRLDEIVVGAVVEALDDVLEVALGGQHDDRHERQAGVGLQRLEGFDAVHARHHDVENDDVGFQRAGLFEAFDAVAGGRDLVALRAQAQLDDLPVVGIVIDDEDEGLFAHGNGDLWRC